jgi:pimeloyl-ACP methyl ester carboxylesterase
MKQFIAFAYLVFALAQFACNHPSANSQSASGDKISIENQGVRIDYTDTGKGDITLLFVHGWCINKTYWSDQVKQFSDQYRIITVDLPGFGESGKNRKNWTTQTYGKDIQTVMNQLNLKNVILIGHSMAGDIIVEAANDAPEKVIGLVGIDNFKGFGDVPDSASKAEFAKAIVALKQNFRQVATEYFNEELFYTTTDSLVRKRVLNDVYQSDSVIAVASMEPGDFNEVTKLAATKKKIHLINSDVTPTDTTGFVANKIPYDILYIHATGHYPMIEKPAEFNALLKQTIDKIKAEKRSIGHSN